MFIFFDYVCFSLYSLLFVCVCVRACAGQTNRRLAGRGGSKATAAQIKRAKDLQNARFERYQARLDFRDRRAARKRREKNKKKRKKKKKSKKKKKKSKKKEWLSVEYDSDEFERVVFSRCHAVGEPSKMTFTKRKVILKGEESVSCSENDEEVCYFDTHRPGIKFTRTDYSGIFAENKVNEEMLSKVPILRIVDRVKQARFTTNEDLHLACCVRVVRKWRRTLGVKPRATITYRQKCLAANLYYRSGGTRKAKSLLNKLTKPSKDTRLLQQEEMLIKLAGEVAGSAAEAAARELVPRAATHTTTHTTSRTTSRTTSDEIVRGGSVAVHYAADKIDLSDLIDRLVEFAENGMMDDEEVGEILAVSDDFRQLYRDLYNSLKSKPTDLQIRILRATTKAKIARASTG